MSHFIIKLDEYYLIWSSVVDAPVTYAFSLDELKEYIKDKYGNEGLRHLPFRLKRVEVQGTSLHYNYTIDDCLSLNRAGPGETRYTKEEIIEHYCIKRDA
jgi:hypothetical protein